MSKITFLILFVLLIVAYGFKKLLLQMIHKNENLQFINEKALNYLFAFLFTILLIAGVLYVEDTKGKYGKISNGFDNIRNPNKLTRPHRYFDINTY